MVKMNSRIPYRAHISSYSDLITTREEIRAGFISFALEKNKRSTPYVQRAKALKAAASVAKNPKELLKITDIQDPLLTASGLSDKAMEHLTDSDKKKAVAELVEKFLEPAGKDFVDELVFRYLLIQGDSLGGSMRNIVGAMAMQKLTRALISALAISGIKYKWLDNRSTKKEWLDGNPDDYDIETNLKAIAWTWKRKNRILAYNTTVPIVKKNIDIVLLDGKMEEFDNGLLLCPKRYLMLGELKGGIDPAGADEHWKTANSALGRIRTAFRNKRLAPKTMFIAAAIENSMAEEIWAQLVSGKITNAANLTDDEQIAHLCRWLIKL